MNPDEQRDKKYATTRKWQKEHPERVREHKRKSDKKHRKKNIARTKKWREANREHCRIYHREYMRGWRAKKKEESEK